jgi:hypothetical protein
MSADEYNTAQWVREHHQNPFEVQDRILRLLIQRDEARAEAAHYRGVCILSTIDGQIEACEARGYKRGVREAAKITEHWHAEITDAILALLDKE